MGKWWSEGTPDFQTPFWECWECWDIPWWNSLKNMVRTTFLFKKKHWKKFRGSTYWVLPNVSSQRERESEPDRNRFLFYRFYRRDRSNRFKQVVHGAMDPHVLSVLMTGPTLEASWFLSFGTHRAAHPHPKICGNETAHLLGKWKECFLGVPSSGSTSTVRDFAPWSLLKNQIKEKHHPNRFIAS